MKKWTIVEIKKAFEEINSAVGLNVTADIIEKREGKFPLYRENGKLVLVADFFNSLTEPEKGMIVVDLYSAVFHDKKRDGHPNTYTEYLAKAICDLMKKEYIPDVQIEDAMRPIRQQYDKPELYCYFSLGERLRLDTFTSVKVINIRKINGQVYISIEPTGYKREKYQGKRVFEEKELYNIVYDYRIKQPIIKEDTVVDLRNNLYVISATLTDKRELFRLLKQRMPELQRIIVATTRKRRKSEVNGIDFHFLAREEFIARERNNEFIGEYSYGDVASYGVFVAEIEKYSKDTPLVLMIDEGLRDFLRRYPLTTSIYLKPAVDELESRVKLHYDVSADSVEWYMDEFTRRMEQSTKYDYVLNDMDLNICASEILNIIRTPQNLVKRDK